MALGKGDHDFLAIFSIFKEESRNASALGLIGPVGFGWGGKKFKLAISINIANFDFVNESIFLAVDFFDFPRVPGGRGHGNNTLIVGGNHQFILAILIHIANFNVS